MGMLYLLPMQGPYESETLCRKTTTSDSPYISSYATILPNTPGGVLAEWKMTISRYQNKTIKYGSK
jgi:hypothetical protein